MGGRRSDLRSDQERNKDCIHKLKSENRQLRKQNNQLQKEIQKLLNQAVQISDNLDTELEENFNDLQKTKEKPLKKTRICPKCNSSNITEIPAGIFMIEKCLECGNKRRGKTF